MQKLLLVFIITFAGCATHHTPLQEPRSITHIPATGMYVVARGDTLWSIAKKYGVSTEALRHSNNLSSAGQLRVGQALRIPQGSVSVSERVLFAWPLRGEVVSSFGSSVSNLKNKGLNIKTGALEVVRASAAGKVVFVDHIKGWGQTIVLKHSSNFYTVYANVQDVEVTDNVFVQQGQSLARVACGPDGKFILHFEIRRAHAPQDPLRYLN